MGEYRITNSDITGVILAGGQASRMGHIDKGLLKLAGRPLVEYAIQRLAPQVGQLLISANRNLPRYAQYGYHVIADSFGEYQGPLSGMYSAMSDAQTSYIVTVPCDCPLFPLDLVDRLSTALARAGTKVCIVRDRQRVQPVFAMVSTKLASLIHQYLAQGNRKLEQWLLNQSPAIADFTDGKQCFFNINTPADKLTAERFISES